METTTCLNTPNNSTSNSALKLSKLSWFIAILLPIPIVSTGTCITLNFIVLILAIVAICKNESDGVKMLLFSLFLSPIIYFFGALLCVIFYVVVPVGVIIGIIILCRKNK